MNKEHKMFIDYMDGKLYFLCPETYTDFIDSLTVGISDIVDFERPDMYIPLDNGKVLILEHFEFSSAESSGWMGLSNKRIDDSINADFNTKVETNLNNGVHDTIAHYDYYCTYSYKAYLENLLYAFNKHIVKLDAYKKNVIQKFLHDGKTLCEDDILTAFLIIDSSELGSLFEVPDKTAAVGRRFCGISVFNSFEFLDTLVEHPELNYVFSGYVTNDKSFVYCMKNTKDNINEFKATEYSAKESDFVNVTPHAINFSSAYTKEELENELKRLNS